MQYIKNEVKVVPTSIISGKLNTPTVIDITNIFSITL